jgi:hypothetical protein
MLKCPAQANFICLDRADLQEGRSGGGEYGALKVGIVLVVLARWATGSGPNSCRPLLRSRRKSSAWRALPSQPDHPFLVAMLVYQDRASFMPPACPAGLIIFAVSNAVFQIEDSSDVFTLLGVTITVFLTVCRRSLQCSPG